MKDNAVTLGFEIGSGLAVNIPIRNMVITGQTQESGKTSTLDALLHRAPESFRSVVFLTKRGERSFTSGYTTAPYFRERADWQFVSSIIESTMRERMKFERAWIMRAAKGAHTLAGVLRNVRLLAKDAKGLSADMYMQLGEYLELVVPRIASIDWAPRLDLRPGAPNAMVINGEEFPAELQGLVIRSALEWVHDKMNHTISVIPEAWEFLPQSRSSPVKLAATALVRKGSALKNYVWLDSQDIGGIDKEILRSCPVWLLGVQRETNEIKRVLDNIPAGLKKPKAADVARLKMGEFFACFGDTVVKTYVWPRWIDEGTAQDIAMGAASIQPSPAGPLLVSVKSTDPVTLNRIEEDPDMSAETEKKLDKLINILTPIAGALAAKAAADAAVDDEDDPPPLLAVSAFDDEDALFDRFKARLLADKPALLKVLGRVPAIEIQEVQEVITVDGKSLRGGIARLIYDGFFDKPTKAYAAFMELKRLGRKVAKPNVYTECKTLSGLGFLTQESEGYQTVPSMKKNIRRPNG